eukprot:681528-Pelagomonas_calceolata.AAC.4
MDKWITVHTCMECMEEWSTVHTCMEAAAHLSTKQGAVFAATRSPWQTSSKEQESSKACVTRIKVKMAPLPATRKPTPHANFLKSKVLMTVWWPLLGGKDTCCPSTSTDSATPPQCSKCLCTSIRQSLICVCAHGTFSTDALNPGKQEWWMDECWSCREVGS